MHVCVSVWGYIHMRCRCPRRNRKSETLKFIGSCEPPRAEAGNPFCKHRSMYS